MARIIGSLVLFVVGYFGGRVTMMTVMGVGGESSKATPTYSVPASSDISANPFVD